MNILCKTTNELLLSADDPVEIQARNLARKISENAKIYAQINEHASYVTVQRDGFDLIVFECRLIKSPTRYHELVEIYWPASLEFEGDLSDIGNFKTEFFNQAQLTLKRRSMEALKEQQQAWSPYREILSEVARLVNHKIKKARLWRTEGESDIVHIKLAGGARYLMGGYAADDEKITLQNPEAVKILAISNETIDRVKVIERSREEETEVLVEFTINTRTVLLEWLVRGDEYPHLPFKKVSDQ